MTDVKVTACATLRNEVHHISDVEHTVEGLLGVVESVVLVDGGSTDGTFEHLTAWRDRLAAGGVLDQHRTEVEVMSAPGTGISAGRNIAIAASSAPFVIVFDAGCAFSPGWAEALVAQLGSGRLVKGLSVARPGGTWWERGASKALAKRTATQLRSATPGSSRCLGFDREIWEQAGRYPEHLATAEDTVFWLRALDRAQPIVCPEAQALWSPGDTVRAVFQKYRGYGRGDACAGLVSKSAYAPLVHGSVIAAAVLGRARPVAAVLLVSYLGARLRARGIPAVELPAAASAIVVADLGSALGRLEGLRARRVRPRPAR